jgi:hypothetical protein
MLPRLTAAVDTAAVMAADTAVAMVADTSVADTLAVADTLRPDISGPGTSRLGAGPPYTSGLDFTRAHSSGVDTGGIFGMAVGGITASARAGYGRTITASMCGPATKGSGSHSGDPNRSSQL